MTPIVRFDLPNEVYHHGAEWKEYISSSQLKDYAVSPLYAKQKMESNEESTNASFRIGTLFHECMELINKKEVTPDQLFEQYYTTFVAPINPTSGKPYGAGTAKYETAYREFLDKTDGKIVVSATELDQLKHMVASVMGNPIVQKFLKWGKYNEEKMTGSEISVFVEIDGVKMKARFDLLTSNKVIDWKSCSLPDLRQDSIVKQILNYKYDLSAAFYQKVLHELTDTWYGFYWVFVQSVAPYDCVVVDANFMAHTIVDGEMVNDETHGCLECNTLLEIHKECLESNEWKGNEIFIQPDEKGNRIMTVECPAWAMNNLTKKY